MNPPPGHVSWTMDHSALVELIGQHGAACVGLGLNPSEGTAEIEAALKAVLDCLTHTYAAPTTASTEEGANP